MWPFDLMRRRKYERRYKAALVVFLGTYATDHLTPEQHQRIESEVDKNLNRTDMPAAAWRRVLGPSAMIGACRCAAMERVGIPPAVAGLSWADLFQPWSFFRIRNAWPVLRRFDMLPVTLVNDFRPMHQATADARTFLRQHGVDVPEFDPWDHAPPRVADGVEKSKTNVNAA